MPSRAPSLRRTFNRMLTHRYTLTPMTAGTEDAEGNTPSAPGASVTGLPGLFSWDDQMLVDEGGRRRVSTPTLYAPYDAVIAVGDAVSAIVDQDGTTLLASATVDTIDPAAEAGGSVLKICRLRGAVVVRTP